MNNFDTSSSTFNICPQTNSTLVDTIVKSDSIELIYTELSVVSFWPNNGNDYKVYKIIYSVVDGNWNASERIYGNIKEATNETYEFE